ncbi:MAG: hypothetical protein HY776_00035 [Actinobacteria bacterium]|nr:hypothetical protein [Actinomycetota bacterium]
MKKNKIYLVLLFLVLSIIATGCKTAVKLTYKSKKGETLRYRMTTKTNTISNGAKEQESPITGKSFTITHTKEGKILEIEELKDVIQEQSTEQELNKLFQEIQNEFPQKELNEGDTWNVDKKIKMPNLGEMDVVVNYKFLGFQNENGINAVKISTDLKAQFDFNQKQNGTSIEIKGEENGSGTILFDNEEGKLLNSQMVINANIDTKYDIPPELENKPPFSKIPRTSTAKTKTDLGIELE